MARRLANGEGPSGLEVVKDNLEAFAIAIVMALVIKHFCLEAFKIPTGSMMPTLKGDVGGSGGDRILVDKLAYLLSGPSRWDVVVFRYPLDASRNFIKRVAGLPEERLRILRGDIWVKRLGEADWRIATKSRRPRDELCTTVWPPSDRARGPEEVARMLATAFESESPGAWRTEAIDRLEFAGGAEAALRYRPTIRSTSNAAAWDGGGGHVAHDARFRGRLTAAGPATVAFSWRAAGDVLCEVRVSTAGFGEPSAAAVRRASETKEVLLPLLLQPGTPLVLEMEAIDGELIVSADGREVARLPQGRRVDDPEDYGREDQRFLIRAAGAGVTVEGLRIDRDLWYADHGMETLDPEHDGLEIPEDAYFMLGDNTEQSSDSRKWVRECLTLKDGRRICWDGSRSGSSSTPTTWRPGYDGTPPRDLVAKGGTIRHVVDVDGVERWWQEEEEDAERSMVTANVPFVKRDAVVGRAFFIFWPVLPGFPGRLNFIH